MSLVPDDGKSYAVATIAGRQLRETSAVGSFPRPAQPIVLYEFEGEELLDGETEVLFVALNRQLLASPAGKLWSQRPASCGPPSVTAPLCLL